jgi:hypothetical protein
LTFFTDASEIALYFFDAMTSLNGFVHVRAAYGDVEDRIAVRTDEMMMESFVDVVSEF